MCRCSLCIGIFILAYLPIGSVFSEEIEKELEELVVTSHPLSEGGVAQSLSILQGDELAAKLQGSLGETVASDPGIHSASFGVAVGRPVIHGLGGARVKTTQDRIDSLDVSVTSSDHAVSIEPFIANQINILKGASTLLYGSGAIGGVVDVETGRIPTQRPDRALQGRAEFRFADNADATTSAIRLDGSAGKSLAWHVDVFDKQADDYEIPEFSRSSQLGPHPEEPNGILSGSAFDSRGGALGLSYIGKRGHFGMALGDIDAEYGLVVAEGGESPGLIELRQTRIDLDAHLDAPFDGFLEMNLRVGLNDYQHLEIEGSGEIGTVFENKAWEGRFELAHNPVMEIAGEIGLQLSGREFSAVGEEAFVPPVDSATVGLFWVGERRFDGFDIEAGVRLDRVDYEGSDQGTTDLSFTTLSSSLGAVWPISEVLTLSALLDFSGRAPSIEELYSNGPHLATQSFEIGNQQLEDESAIATSLTLNYETDKFTANISAYHMKFSDFIYQQNTGDIEDDLPVFVYVQGDAQFYGIDFEGSVELGKLGDYDVSMTVLADFVEAQLANSVHDGAAQRNLPRIPPARVAVGAEFENHRWSGSLRFSRVSKQSDVAQFENPSEAYNDFSLRINRRFVLGEKEINLTLHGRNLSNQEQRHHASFIKDFAPAPGRRIEAGLRFLF